MAKKVYAIKEGYDSSANQIVQNKIVGTWAECLKYVKGIKGAKYKSFEHIEDAKLYLSDTKALLKKGRDEYPEDWTHIYVDGSYNINTQKYAYGFVVVKDNAVEYIESGSPDDTSKSKIRQIAGELQATVEGLEYYMKKNKGNKETLKVVLLHDYEGIFHHGVGTWERKDESSAEYYDKMNTFFKAGLEVIFVKVDSHTGDLYNELADESCKKRLGITSDKIVQKWLKNNKLYVINEQVKAKVLELINDYEDNIITLNDESNLESLKAKKTINIREQIINIVDKLSDQEQLDLLKYMQNMIGK